MLLGLVCKSKLKFWCVVYFFSFERKLYYVIKSSGGKFPVQRISLEHPAENAEKFIVFREFSPV